MKIFSSFLIVIFINTSSFSQLITLSQKTVIENKVKEIKVLNIDIGKKSELHNRVMELKKFNLNGLVEYSYNFNVDVIYTKDSTIYNYDNNGNLSLKTNYYIENPIGKKQLDFLKEMGNLNDGKPSIKIHKYYYNVQNQLIQTDFEVYGEVDERTFTYYDSLKRISKEIVEYKTLPQNNNITIYYFYNKEGKLQSEKTFQNENNEETLYSYDSLGNLISEEIRQKMKQVSIKYIYDTNNRLIEKKKNGYSAFEGGETNIYYTYIYDHFGNITEEKTFQNKLISFWIKYTYNEKHLLKEERWLDAKGKTKNLLVYEYLYY